MLRKVLCHSNLLINAYYLGGEGIREEEKRLRLPDSSKDNYPFKDTLTSGTTKTIIKVSKSFMHSTIWPLPYDPSSQINYKNIYMWDKNVNIFHVKDYLNFQFKFFVSLFIFMLCILSTKREI